MSETPDLPPLPPVTNIRRYRYRKGDHIVVRINQKLDDFSGQRLREIASSSLGVPICDILVLDGGSDVKVLRNVAESQK